MLGKKIKGVKLKENKKRIEINLDKHIYDFIKRKNINASKLIRQLLNVALFSGSTDYTPYATYTQTYNPAKLESKDYLGSNPSLCASTGFGQLTPNDKQFAVFF